MATFAEYKAATNTSIQKRIYKIEWMDKDENIIDEVITDLISGSVSIQRANGVRRSCNVTFENEDGRFTPDNDGLVYIAKKFKLYSGLIINGEEAFPPESVQGVFNLGNPIVKSDSSSNTVTIEGYDNFALLNGNLAGQIDATTLTISRGQLLTDVVKDVLNRGEIIQSPLMDISTQVLPYEITKEAGSTYKDILVELAGVLAWDIYFNVHGQPVFKPRPDQQNLNHTWLYSTTGVSYLGCDHNYNYNDVRNYIIVYGDNVDGDLSSAIAQDNGVFSPTSISRIGKRTLTIEDNLIPTDEIAQERANYELRQAIEAYEYIDLKSINIDFLKEGDIILVDDEEAGISEERFIVDQINRNLDFNSQMTIKAWKVREI